MKEVAQKLKTALDTNGTFTADEAHEILGQLISLREKSKISFREYTALRNVTNRLTVAA